MKTVILVLTLLSFVHSQFVFDESKFETAIFRTVQIEHSNPDCLNQLSLLSAFSIGGQSSWANDSEFQLF